MSKATLFQPTRIGDIRLQHRIVFAPMTRLRASSSCAPVEMMTEYYRQRASTQGTLLITETTAISAAAGGIPNIPHIETKEQLDAWKKVTTAVHENGSFIFCQISALGRCANPQVLAASGNYDVIGPSDIPVGNGAKPRPMTLQEIKAYIQAFGNAAANAVNEAHFDGIELHACHGSLLDQFLQDVSNNRIDQYGGSVENCARFVLEVIEACVNAVGPKKVAVRLSPWNDTNGMGMQNPIPTYTYLVTQLSELFPDLAYLHVVEPRTLPDGQPREVKPGQSNDFLRALWVPKTFISAGGYTKELAIETTNTHNNELVAFGRHFLANPDLPKRLRAGVDLNPYDRSTFYSIGEAKGYVDYPFYEGEETKDMV